MCAPPRTVKLIGAYLTYLVPSCPVFYFFAVRPDNARPVVSLASLPGNVLVTARSLHRLPSAWTQKYKSFSLSFVIHAGMQQLHVERACESAAATKMHLPLPAVVWSLPEHSGSDSISVELPVPLAELPREARLIVYVHGHTGPHSERLGWVALPLVSHSGFLAEGDYVLGLWLRERAPALGTWPSAIGEPTAPFVVVGLPLGPALIRHDLEPTDVALPPAVHRVRRLKE